MLLDFCLPDYFTGYHKEVCAIPIYRTMTHGEVADEIESEMDYDERFYENEDTPIWEAYLEELRNPDCKDEIFFEQSELGSTIPF